MTKSISMESRGVRHHQVQKTVDAFIASDMKSVTIKNVLWTEWSDRRNCLRSFKRAIRNLGYKDRVTVVLQKNKKILLIKTKQ